MGLDGFLEGIEFKEKCLGSFRDFKDWEFLFFFVVDRFCFLGFFVFRNVVFFILNRKF